MKVNTTQLPATVDILYNNKRYSNVIMKKNPNDYGYIFQLPGAGDVYTQDYDDRFDVHYTMSDDGTRFYEAVCVIGQDIDFDFDELSRIKAGLAGRIMDYYMVRQMGESQDMIFLLNVLTPVWMYQRIAANNGDVENAVHLMIQEVFLWGSTFEEASF